MPLIGGNKYSCEPCIRGHRATHCQHTDRLLIEVRKPGRPLDRCGHKLASCRCGRIDDVKVLNVNITSSSTSSGSSPSSGLISPRPVFSGVEQKSRDGQVGGVREKEGGEQQQIVMISRDQPFARELRLSQSNRKGREGSSSSSGSDDEKNLSSSSFDPNTSGRRKSKMPSSSSSASAAERERERERKKAKVYKRHRLGAKSDSETKSMLNSINMDAPEATRVERQRKSRRRVIEDEDYVDEDVQMRDTTSSVDSTTESAEDDEEGEEEDTREPALSPSVSESSVESESSLVAVEGFVHQTQHFNYSLPRIMEIDGVAGVESEVKRGVREVENGGKGTAYRGISIRELLS